MRPKKIKNESEDQDESKEISTKNFALSYLNSKDVKDHHFNYEQPDSYVVTTGSLIVDNEIGGGYRPGLQRMSGASGGGKTSHVLDVLGNFLEDIERSKGIYIKAEGRLSENMKERRGVKFVSNPEEWEIGTCLLFETNVYEVVFDFIRNLLKFNKKLPVEKRERYFFIIDSIDGLITKADLEKTTAEANKVAAGALLQSDFYKRVSLSMSKFGHLCFIITQVRSKVSIDPYAPKDPNAMVASSGGNAAVHYPDYIFDFKRQMPSNKILPNPDERISNTNKPLGHYVELVVAKSDNENQMMTIKYPVRYGRKGRSSVWIEREIIEMMLMWGYISKGGAWFSFDQEVVEFVKEKLGLDVSAKIQGMTKMYSLLEENLELTKLLRGFVTNKIMNPDSE